MLSKKVQKAINDQINAELYSAYLYFSMSNWFKAQYLDGFADWLKVQAGEEQGHAMRFYDYLHSKNAAVELQAVAAPPKEWNSALAAFEDAYKHEKKITGMINKIGDLAVTEKDHATLVFLNWFFSEQVEEEESTLEMVEKLKMVASYPGGLYMLNKEAGSRDKK